MALVAQKKKRPTDWRRGPEGNSDLVFLLGYRRPKFASYVGNDTASYSTHLQGQSGRVDGVDTPVM